MIRVVIADDQSMIRSALRALIEEDGDISVVAEAPDGAEAVEAVRRHRPDVVVMDVRMPRLDGLEATRQIRALAPSTSVIVLTTYDIDEYVFEAVRAGASGFLLKDGDADQLTRAIRMSQQGESLIAPTALTRLLTEFTRVPTPDPDAVAAVATLTSREREVLDWVARGLSNREVAQQIVVSEATVKTHVGAILTKLGARDRTQAVVTAFLSGLAPG